MARRETPIAAAVIMAAGMLFALPAAARPYLMLTADDRGFQALDLGAIDRSQASEVLATVIEAPLAGADVGGRLAPLIERRVQVDCSNPRWRVVKLTYLDGQEHPLAASEGESLGQPPPPSWTAFDDDGIAPAVQAAACRREYRAQAVSRYRNLGEILANYQAVHAKAAPEPPTEKELQARKFRNSH